MKDEYLSSNSDRRYLCEEYARDQWGPVVAKANASAEFFKNEAKRLEAENAKLALEASHGRAFLKMMAAIKENPAAQTFWDKTMAMMRLVE